MASKPFTSEEVTEWLFSFPKGMNAGVAPIALPKDQLANAYNITVVGDFASPRPGYQKQLLSYPGDTTGTVKSGSTSALWQGAAFYQPDIGASCMFAAIGGRLFQFTPDSQGNCTVVEQTIPGDPNPSTVSIAWLWQAENFLIWNDGQSIPVFFDGTSSRRATQGGGAVVATIDAGCPAVPVVGASITAPVIPNFTGQYNQFVNLFSNTGVLIGTFLLQATTVVANAVLTVPPNTSYLTTIPAGNSVVTVSANPTFVPIGTYIGPTQNFNPNETKTLLFAYTSLPIAGTNIQFAGTPGNFQVLAVNGSSWTIKSLSPFAVATIKNSVVSGISPSSYTVVGVLQVALVLNGGGSFPVTLNTPYTGAAGLAVLCFGLAFTIAPATTTGTANILLLNENAVALTAIPAGSTLVPVPELPPGRMGVYGMGRNWVCLTDGRSFIASDIVGGSSGSSTFKFRDAVLRTTENTYLAGGGNFLVPGNVGDIRAMIFVATLDTSLGQGPLQIFTPNTVFSCQAPVDRATWQAITNPILTESLIGNGASGQNSTVLANSDTLFRSPIGICSLILARRDFDVWGNVPISHEVAPFVDADAESLLSFASAIDFDNRMLMTSSPVQATLGVFWQNLIALNFDPISSLAGKAPSVYDGIWSGINVLQVITDTFNGVERAFAFTLNTATSQIELVEILKTGAANYDNGNVPITCAFESATIFNQGTREERDLIRLTNGEIYVDDLIGQVNFTVYYKPDDYPNWVLWHSWSETQAPSTTVNVPEFRPRMGLGQPDGKPCDTVTNRPLREGFAFQIRVVIQGHCTFKGGRFMGVTIPQPKFAPPNCSAPPISPQPGVPSNTPSPAIVPPILNFAPGPLIHFTGYDPAPGLLFNLYFSTIQGGPYQLVASAPTAFFNPYDVTGGHPSGYFIGTVSIGGVESAFSNEFPFLV